MADKKVNTSISKAENIIADYIFESDFYQIKNWVFDFNDDKKSINAYNDCLCIVLIKKGNYLFDLHKDSYNTHLGHIIIEKPNYQYSLRPCAGECSIFNFTNEFYKQYVDSLGLVYSFFFSNNNISSLMLNATPEAEYLHSQILRKSNGACKLEMDNLVLEFFNDIVASITNRPLEGEMNASLKANHLTIVEKAKEFINERFSNDISLYEISRYSCVSPFHFSRVFKKFTSFSPYQYLLNIRLKHAEIMLKTSLISISEISISSGFNTAENFATAFKRKYKLNPTQYRLEY
jgi:AraC family transcriptional regulator